MLSCGAFQRSNNTYIESIIYFSELERDPCYVGLTGKKIPKKGLGNGKKYHGLKVEFACLSVCVCVCVWSIPKSIECFGLTRCTFECDPYYLHFNNLLISGYYILSVKIMIRYGEKDLSFLYRRLRSAHFNHVHTQMLRRNLVAATTRLFL